MLISRISEGSARPLERPQRFPAASAQAAVQACRSRHGLVPALSGYRSRIEEAVRFRLLLPGSLGIEASPLLLLRQRPTYLTVFLLEGEGGWLIIDFDEGPPAVIDFRRIAVILQRNEQSAQNAVPAALYRRKIGWHQIATMPWITLGLLAPASALFDPAGNDRVRV